MKKILKNDYNLEGKTVYLERTDCSFWELGAYDYNHNSYIATNDNGETRQLTTSDLIGNFVL